MGENKRCDKCGRIWTLLCAALLMIAVGIASIGCLFSQYTALLLKRQDEQLFRIAAARDRNLASKFEVLHNQMAYMFQRSGFVKAEQEWVQTGSAEKLVSHMADNPAAQDDVICAMLVIQDGQTLLSTANRTDYVFPSGTTGHSFPCQDSDGTLYMAFAQPRGNLTYALLLDLHHYLADMTALFDSEEFRLMLLDASGEIWLHQWMGENRVDTPAGINPLHCDTKAYELLQKIIAGQETTEVSYHLVYPGDTETHEMRMVSIPVHQSLNGCFSVALIAHFDAMITPMHQAAWLLLLYGGLIAAGMIILSLLTISLMRRNRLRTQEVDRLREQNQEISILLEKTQQLAHHQRLETIGTLTSGIAHEFNNLLTPIMSYSLMTLEDLPEEMQEIGENVARIYEASSKAKTLVGRLGELSRKNTGLPMHALQLDEAIRKAVEMASTACPANVRIAEDLQCGAACITGNETQMSQLFLNLIINAFNAMEKGGGQLTVTSRRTDDALLVQVADTGCGIPPDVLPRIFEPFFTTRIFENGTGLGLSIAQQVMESHHGSIEVESTMGEGAVFTLRFPAEPSDAQKQSS